MNYQVVKPLWDGSNWHQVGAPFPSEGTEVKPADLEKYLKGGFIDTPENIARKENPEAHDARAALQQAQARVAELERQLLEAGQAGAQPLEELRAELSTAQASVGTLTRERDDAQRQVKTLGERVGALTSQVGELTREKQALQTTLTQTEGQLAAAQARVTTLEALVKPEGEGTPLPANFLCRGKLAAFGLDTYESLRGKTAGQLDAIEGITPEQAGKIAELVAAFFAKAE